MNEGKYIMDIGDGTNVSCAQMWGNVFGKCEAPYTLKTWFVDFYK